MINANTGSHLTADPEKMQWWTQTTKRFGISVELAVEAAQMGFDEVQYDYVRSTDGNVGVAPSALPTPRKTAPGSRRTAPARPAALKPLGAKLVVDTFGYAS